MQCESRCALQLGGLGGQRDKRAPSQALAPAHSMLRQASAICITPVSVVPHLGARGSGQCVHGLQQV